MTRILIIEDEPDVATSIKNYLEASGYQVETALDAEKGIKMLGGFDLLLLDLIMPKISGRGVLKKMRDLGLTKPVIVLSAISLPKLVGRELSAEYPGLVFVPKTALLTELIPAIKKALGE